MFTTFRIPVRRDRVGEPVTEPIAVQNEMLPLMADIIRKATRPVLLTKMHQVREDQMGVSEAHMRGLRAAITRSLILELREYAVDQGLAVITKPVVTDGVEDGYVVFRCTATAMPLLETGLDA